MCRRKSSAGTLFPIPLAGVGTEKILLHAFTKDAAINHSTRSKSLVANRSDHAPRRSSDQSEVTSAADKSTDSRRCCHGGFRSPLPSRCNAHLTRITNYCRKIPVAIRAKIGSPSVRQCEFGNASHCCRIWSNSAEFAVRMMSETATRPVPSQAKRKSSKFGEWGCRVPNVTNRQVLELWRRKND